MLFILFALGIGISSVLASGSEPSNSVTEAPGGWRTSAPRDELRPAFAFEARGGLEGGGCFIIRADAREGLDGAWTKIFPVTGAKHYHFSGLYRARSVAVPRRSIVAKIDWQ